MKDYKKVKVLLLDGGGRQALPILYDIKELGCQVTTLNTTKLDNGYVSRYPDEKLLINNKQGKKIFYAAVQEEISTGRYDIVIPLGDLSTDFITSNEAELAKYAYLGCAPREAYIQAFNKQYTYERCLETQIPCPFTRMDDQSVEDFLAKAHFPIIIKPRKGTGSIGFRRIEQPDILRKLIASGEVKPDDYIIQECVSDFKIRYFGNVFFDQSGEVKSVVTGITTRWFPVDAGAGSMCQSANLPQIADSSVKLLKAMKWKGFAQVTYMLDPRDNISKVIEINGRIPAGIKINRMSGVSIGRQLVEFALGEDVTDYGRTPKENVVTRCLQTDFLWFLKSPNRFKCKPSWFRCRNSHDTTFSIKDPLPFFTYSIQHLKTMRADIKKRKHQ